MNHPNHLASLLARLLSVPDANRRPNIWKGAFPNNGQLQTHLEKLGVPQLEWYLVWIPPDRLMTFEEIGKGGFATVYKGTVSFLDDKGTQTKSFALKDLSKEMVPELVLNTILTFGDRQGNALPINELVGLTRHPTTGDYLMVSRFSQYGTLEHKHMTNWRHVAQFAWRLARRLSTLHGLGFCHNDLHPGNVVLDIYSTDGNTEKYSDLPRLIDVGLSTAIENVTGTPAGIYGRYDYLPPEAFVGRPRGTWSDVYCLGTLMWQLVIGVPPRGHALEHRVDGLREDPIPGAPKQFIDIIAGCWDREPDRRPTAQAVSIALRNWWGKMDEEDFAQETLQFIAERRAAYEYEKEASNKFSQFHTYEKLADVIVGQPSNS